MTPNSRHGRLNIKISEDTSRALKALSTQHETTATDVVRRAVALLALVDEENRAGRTVEIVSPGGGRERLRLLW